MAAPISQEDKDAWFHHMARDYERQTRGLTRDVVRQLLPLLAPINGSSVVHDNAAGPSIATTEILKQFPVESPNTDIPRIYATDNNASMMSVMSETISKDYPKEVAAHVTTDVNNGEDLKSVPSNTITHSFTGFGIHVFEDPVVGAKEIYRTLVDGGKAAVTIWKENAIQEILQKAQYQLRPDLPKFVFLAPKWDNVDYLVEVMCAGDFRQEKIALHVVIGASGKFDSEDDLLSPFEARAPIVTRGWPEKTRARWKEAVRSAFTPEQRKNLAISQSAWVAICEK